MIFCFHFLVDVCVDILRLSISVSGLKYMYITRRCLHPRVTFEINEHACCTRSLWVMKLVPSMCISYKTESQRSRKNGKLFVMLHKCEGERLLHGSNSQPWIRKHKKGTNLVNREWNKTIFSKLLKMWNHFSSSLFFPLYKSFALSLSLGEYLCTVFRTRRLTYYTCFKLKVHCSRFALGPLLCLCVCECVFFCLFAHSDILLFKKFTIVNLFPL